MRRDDLAVLALLWLVGLYFRLPVFAASALAPQISGDLALGDTATGALTTLPVVLLAVGALWAGRIASRWGARTTVAFGLLLMASASAVRGLAPEAVTMLAATAAMGAGIAGMQTATPALVRDWTPARVGLGSAVYLNGMMAGEFIGAALTLPLVVPLAGGDWRLAFIIWSLPAVAISAPVFFARRRSQPREGNTPPGLEAATAAAAPWRDPRTWRIGLMLGSAITTFFVVNAYMGRLLEARGELDHLDIALALFNAAGLAGSVFMLRYAGKWVGRQAPLAVTTALSALGLSGFMLLAGAAATAMAMLACFVAVVELVLLLSLLPRIAAGQALNGMVAGVYTIGYTTGFLIPLAGGVLAEMTGVAPLALAPAAGLTVLSLGLVTGRRFDAGSDTACDAVGACRQPS